MFLCCGFGVSGFRLLGSEVGSAFLGCNFGLLFGLIRAFTFPKKLLPGPVVQLAVQRPLLICLIGAGWSCSRLFQNGPTKPSLGSSWLPKNSWLSWFYIALVLKPWRLRSPLNRLAVDLPNALAKAVVLDHLGALVPCAAAIHQDPHLLAKVPVEGVVLAAFSLGAAKAGLLIIL